MNHKQYYSKVQCSCGSIFDVRHDALKKGKSKKCGDCSRSKNLGVLSSLRHVESAYKNSAKRGGKKYNLASEHLYLIIQQPCYYCGRAGSGFGSRSNLYTPKYFYFVNGVDRLDSSKGYICHNVVSCCWTCNNAKGALSLKEFKEWIKLVYLWNKTKPK